jgi:hypothetical protein
MIVLSGVRDSDGIAQTLTLSVDPKLFETSAGKTIDVRGALAEGEAGENFFMPFGGRIASGKLTLAKAGMKPGDAVEGEFELKISETRGGFMGGRGFGRGGPARGFRGGPGGFEQGRGGPDRGAPGEAR